MRFYPGNARLVQYLKNRFTSMTIKNKLRKKSVIISTDAEFHKIQCIHKERRVPCCRPRAESKAWAPGPSPPTFGLQVAQGRLRQEDVGTKLSGPPALGCSLSHMGQRGSEEAPCWQEGEDTGLKNPGAGGNIKLPGDTACSQEMMTDSKGRLGLLASNV